MAQRLTTAPSTTATQTPATLPIASVPAIAEASTNLSETVSVSETFPQVLRRFEQEQAQSLRFNFLFASFSVPLFALVLIGFVGVAQNFWAGMQAGHYTSGAAQTYSIAFLCFGSWGFFGFSKWFTWYTNRLAEKAPESAVSALAKMKDEPRALGPLIDALKDASPAQRPVLLAALTPRLWELSKDDALSLSSERRAILRNQLLTGETEIYLSGRKLWERKRRGDLSDTQTDFALAAMRALAFVGDAKATETFERLAQTDSDAHTTNAEIRRDAAQECLALLQAQCQKRDPIVKRLRELLNKRDPNLASLTQANAIVDTLSHEQANIVLAEICETERQRTTKRLFAIIVPPSALLTFYAILGTIFWSSHRGNWLIQIAVQLCCFALPLVALWRYPQTPAYKEAAARLQITDDVRLLGTMLDSLAANGDVRGAVLSMLRQIEPGDEVYLNARQRAKLRGILSGNLSATLEWSWKANATELEIVMRAVATMGDRKALRLIKRIGQHYPNKTLRSVARSCTEQLSD